MIVNPLQFWLLSLILLGCTFKSSQNKAKNLDPPHLGHQVANCQLAQRGDCQWYRTCLESAQPCDEQGYAIGYGLKYCERFHETRFFTEIAIVWRDNVRLCLQEQLVTSLRNEPQFSCQQIEEVAFNSHPSCYTADPSICELSYLELPQIFKTIGMSTALEARSRKQMLAVAKTCLGGLLARVGFGLHDQPGEQVATDPQIETWRQIIADLEATVPRDSP